MSDPETKYASAHRFKFADGDKREICEWLTGLALEGKKTGTCWPLRDFADGEPMVTPGDIAVYTDWDGNDVCAIRYTKVEIHRFDRVPVEFALSEGEGDYDAWRDGHITFFKRNGGFSPDMQLVCETFRVIEIF